MFDSAINLKNAQNQKYQSKICNIEKVKRHKFWPFIRVDQMVRRFGKETQDNKESIVIKHKSRHIMYASHLDAMIMSFYAWILKNNYEASICNSLADNSVLGYRKIPLKSNPEKNKSNIDFAFEAYQKIITSSDAVILCVDIEDFFGSINHHILFEKAANFEPEELREFFPPILKAVTKYRYVFRHDIERKLGKEKRWNDSGRYNNLIRNSDIIHKNKKNRGIPQGSPISDVLSNIYLYDFDLWLVNELSNHPGAYYRRYVDDILLIMPRKIAHIIYEEMISHLNNDLKLSINSTKTKAYYVDAEQGLFSKITKDNFRDNSFYRWNDSKSMDVMQYLGFSMNLHFFAIRPGTVANCYRKEIGRIKRLNMARYGRQKSKTAKKRYKKIYQDRSSRSLFGYPRVAAKKSKTIQRQSRHIKRRITKLRKNMTGSTQI